MRKILTGCITAFLLLLSMTCAALTLYEQPDEKSKVVVTLTKDIALIPIFDPHKGDWIKVADPSNGNVGWIKSNELKSHSAWPHSTAISVQEQTVTTDPKTGAKPQTYRIIVLGGANPLKAEEAQALVKQMQERQQRWQQHFDRIMQRIYYQAKEFEDDFFNFPLLPRVIIVPQAETKPGTGTTATPPTSTSVTPAATSSAPAATQPNTTAAPQPVTAPQPNKIAPATTK